MILAFRLFQERRDVRVVEALPQPEVPGLHAKPVARTGLTPRVEREPEEVVHDLLEGTAAPPCLRLKARGHVFLEGERRPRHITMLTTRHHDVNEPPPAFVPYSPR